MKKLSLIFLCIFSFLISANCFSSEIDNNLGYDTGFIINGQKIWISGGPRYERKNDVCMEVNGDQLNCVVSCYWCGEDEAEKNQTSLLPINDKGILYFYDEFDLRYYDIASKKEMSVAGDIYNMLDTYNKYQDMNFMEDRYFEPFNENSLNTTKDKLAIEVVYNNDATMKVLDSMICIVDINKLSEGETDYIKCPIIAKSMDRLNVSEIPENTWTEKVPPVFEGWKDNNSISIQTNEGGDFILDTSANKLEKLPQEVIFKDIPLDSTLYGPTKRAKEQGWISGYPDGTFKPNNPVNRAEFAKMLALAFGKGEGKRDSLEKFPDVLFNQWYIPFLSKAVELKIMEGYPDGKMRPANTIIKAEALKMALETLGKDYGATQEGQQWYEKYRLYAQDHLNLSFLSPDDMPKPMTRGECVELISEALAKK